MLHISKQLIAPIATFYMIQCSHILKMKAKPKMPNGIDLIARAMQLLGM